MEVVFIMVGRCGGDQNLGFNLEEPVRVASPTRINLEEPVRVASPTRINLEKPISSGYPAHLGLIHLEEPVRVASPTRINSFTWRNQFLLVT